MIGIDLVKISRIERFIKRFGDKALQKFLCEDEIKLIKNHKTAAGFWAAKEAFSKALGVGIGQECNFLDIAISKTEKGAPLLNLSNKLITNFNIKDTSMAITHAGEYVVAVVGIEKFEPSKSI